MHIDGASDNQLAAARAESDPPSTSMPRTSMPQTSMPQTSMPQTSMPQTSMPQTSMHQTSMHQTSVHQTSMHQTSTPQTSTPQAEPVAIPQRVQEEVVKTCCICGLDVTHKQRSKDRTGRYWCASCHAFIAAADKTSGGTPCPDCGRDTRQPLMVERAGERVCRGCNENYLAELEPRALHKATVTAHAELEIRRRIRSMVKGLIGLALLAVLLTLYHFGLLHLHPRPWVPFVSALYVIGILAVGVGIAIGIQYLRIEFRKRARQAEYDRLIQSAANHVLALDEDSHSSGISESSEPLRRRVDRAIARVEACAGQGVGAAGEIIASFAKKTDVVPLIGFLQAQRPNTTDTVARNREIAAIGYLQGDFAVATAALTAILLRLQHDQDAMTRQALICFRTGDLEQSKKIFKRVINTAREKNSEIDLAAAYCNLGMLHVMLSEFDDAAVRYTQAMVIYNRLSREEGQADCLVNLGLIAYRQKKGADFEDQFRKALAINKRRDRPEGMAICCSLLGVILVEKEVPKLNEAEKLLNEAVRLNLQLGRPAGVASAYGNLGLVRVKRGDFAGASELFLKAQSIYQRTNRPKMVAKIQEMLKTVGSRSAAKAGQSKARK